MQVPQRVQIIEVGPRDGLQNEAQTLDTAVKVDLIQGLVAAGIRHLEATSFVSPQWVPQMADAAQVMAAIPRQPGVCYSVLTPNMRGLNGALAARADEVCVFGAASEAFSQRNINCSVAESIERFAPVVAAAHAAGVATRGAISCAVGCPYEGQVTPSTVRRVAQRMKDIGVQRIAVADTIGVGTPLGVQAALDAALQVYEAAQISAHFHDTYGQALANILASLQMGIAVFETSIAGLGGCPYAKGASGNVATEDVVYMLNGMGIASGIDLDALIDVAASISAVLKRAPNSRVSQARLKLR